MINEWTWLLHKSGLDCGTAEGDVSPPQRQPSTPPAPAAIPSPADAPVPADKDEYSNCSADDGEDDSDSDCVEPTSAKRREWTEDDDAALVAALRAGQKAYTIKIGGRSKGAASKRLSRAREDGTGSPVLREYLEETCPEYVYKPSHRQRSNGWSAEEDQTFIRAHKEGKTWKKIAAMLPGRTHDAVRQRLKNVRQQGNGTAALRAYAAEIPLPQHSISPPLGQWKRIKLSSEPTRRAKQFRRSRQCFLGEQKVLCGADGVGQISKRVAQQLSENMQLKTIKYNGLFCIDMFFY